MRNYLLLTHAARIAAAATPAASQTECGDGTIERDGTCVPADSRWSTPAMCGPFTELHGDQCVPMFPPTMCDPATSIRASIPRPASTTCIGTGGGRLQLAARVSDADRRARSRRSAASSTTSRPTRSSRRATPTGTRCDPTAPTTSGPCALQIARVRRARVRHEPRRRRDAHADRSTIYIDDCGRYRVANIETNGTGPFIGLGFDDAGKRRIGHPTGVVTATTGVATPKPSDRVVAKLRGVASSKPSTTRLAAAAGDAAARRSPGGIYARHLPRAQDRQRRPVRAAGGRDVHEGSAQPMSGRSDYYFQAAADDAHDDRSGRDGDRRERHRARHRRDGQRERRVRRHRWHLGTRCRWEPHAAASLPASCSSRSSARSTSPRTDAMQRLIAARHPARVVVGGSRRSDERRRLGVVPLVVRHERHLRRRGRAAHAEARPRRSSSCSATRKSPIDVAVPGIGAMAATRRRTRSSTTSSRST